ncbi:hypothetical protein BDF19DRAFT_435879, partial [Syncephalis fuscata]
MGFTFLMQTFEYLYSVEIMARLISSALFSLNILTSCELFPIKTRLSSSFLTKIAESSDFLKRISPCIRQRGPYS